MFLKWFKQIDWLPTIFVLLIGGTPILGLIASINFLIELKNFFLGSALGLLLLSPLFVSILKRLFEDYRQIPKPYHRSDWLKTPAFRDFITQLPIFFIINLLVIAWACIIFGMTLPILIHHIISKPEINEFKVTDKHMSHVKQTYYSLNIVGTKNYLSNSINCSPNIFESVRRGDVISVRGKSSIFGFSDMSITFISHQ